MENSSSLTDNKAIIAFLCDKFPACFTQKAEVKPLKIGIFKDLSERLAEDELVSKTRLRQAIRYYTSSLRYLEAIKAGAKRVDLDGNDCEEIDAQHEAHAQERVAEVRKRISERKAKQAEERKQKGDAADAKPKRPQAKRAKPKRDASKAPRKPRAEKINPADLKPISLEKIAVGTKVNVLIGTKPVAAEVVELKDANVQVQLNSGMSVTVPVDKLVDL